MKSKHHLAARPLFVFAEVFKQKRLGLPIALCALTLGHLSHAQAQFEKWSAAPAFQTGSLVVSAPPGGITPGSIVTFSVNGAGDTDTLWRGATRNSATPTSHTDDPMYYHYWSASRGTLSSDNGQSVTWTAPSRPGTYRIKVVVNDTLWVGKTIQAGHDAQHPRNDKPVTISASVTVVEAPESCSAA